MTVIRYHALDKMMDDAAELCRKNSDRRVVGVPQVWHRCAVLLGWRWVGGELRHPDYEGSPIDVEEACEVLGVHDLRAACVLLREAGG